ncbi:MAG: DegT/DnrJ/EryC1/StrS family aminotransferase [Candidatus Pacebacteria bacterium]|nr:DegT/DnrJ/EryC1/StrS family aminotransferase [Candidatus Paceibacterota bacterium]
MFKSLSKKFQPIASSLAPNYTIWDVLIVSRYLFLPWNWRRLQKGKNSRKLERKFCEYVDSRWAVSFENGRSGLYAILKCLGIKDYDEIILQAFTTVALSNAIKWCGAKPIYVDIKKETYNINPEKIEEKITSKTKAIIVQHTFGNPCEMDKIMEIARKHNLDVIEDCAHSLGAEYQNKKLGTIGDVAFFSFGRDKIISAVAGGMVVTNNNKLGEKIKEFKNQMPYQKKSLIVRQLFQPIVAYKSLKLYYFFNLGKVIMYSAVKFKIITKAYSKEERKNKRPENFPAKMPNALAEIALHQMKLIDKFNKHRIEIARLYRNLLERGNITLPKPTTHSKNIFLWFTILVENKKELIKKARKDHLLLGDWFPQAIGPIEVNLEKCDYQKGSCPIAEEVSSRCVNLPTHFRMDKGDVERIVTVIDKFYANQRNNK